MKLLRTIINLVWIFGICFVASYLLWVQEPATHILAMGIAFCLIQSFSNGIAIDRLENRNQ